MSKTNNFNLGYELSPSMSNDIARVDSLISKI
jgi:hypothetical protein